MKLQARQADQCIFCTFRSLTRSLGPRDGRRQFQSGTLLARSPAQNRSGKGDDAEFADGPRNWIELSRKKSGKSWERQRNGSKKVADSLHAQI